MTHLGTEWVDIHLKTMDFFFGRKKLKHLLAERERSVIVISKADPARIETLQCLMLL